ncbi:MAG: DUF2098 domain-containing protein [Candidatus Methylarchaceae archaeon HK01B]|nr:DUF2098 domain-containing protein [Candidatus Methylarchaceae archaeon HK01M]MCP8318351.1 DUF2098 domain-containing protein [Candidatus Methylarchaceae archaeon HK01B]
MLGIVKFAKYKLTGTIGKVIDIKEFDGKTWTQLDNGLYYDVNYIEPISESEFKESRKFRKEKEIITTDEKLRRWIKRLDEEEGKIEFGGLGGAG